MLFCPVSFKRAVKLEWEKNWIGDEEEISNPKWVLCVS